MSVISSTSEVNDRETAELRSSEDYIKYHFVFHISTIIYIVFQIYDIDKNNSNINVDSYFEIIRAFLDYIHQL